MTLMPDTPPTEETWSFWDLKGSTTGPTRGEITQRINLMGKNGWDLALNLVAVGSDGHWPAGMALFQIRDGAALAARLNTGFADGMDECDFAYAETRLMRRLKGTISSRHQTYLLECLQCESAEVLAGYTQPDLVFCDVFAPWQGIALWGSETFKALVQREFDGIGSMGVDGIRQIEGAWFCVPQRDMV